MKREIESLQDWIEDRMFEVELPTSISGSWEICRQWSDGIEITIIINKNAKKDGKREITENSK